MEVAVLGPLMVRPGRTAVDIGAPKLRALLIRLAIDLGRTVPTERLIDDLWDGAPPGGALSSMRAYVSNLRRLLDVDDRGPSVLITQSGGYTLDLDSSALDSRRCERCLESARTEAKNLNLDAALGQLDAGLALWRGPALADVADAPFVRPVIRRLEELRRLAEEERFGLLLDLGRHEEVIADLEHFVDQQPLREKPRRQLILALYRAGRTPDALRLHREFRRTLSDELGLDPSASFEELNELMLRRDPSLESPAATPSTAARSTVTPAAPAPPGGEHADRAARADTATDGPVVFGRRAERRRLEAALDGLRTRHGRLLLVRGEPGIGKSTLLGELARLAPSPSSAHWGWCPETAGAPAF